MSTPSLSILVVEDNPDVSESLAELLGGYGHKTRVARTGDEAVKMVDAFTPDVVILDVGLPDYDGYLTARKLCQVAKRRPLLVAVTGYSKLDERSRSEGFDHHFLKPMDPCVLADLLKQHAEQLAAL
jgi:CheY-like chemotaxis protein